MPAGTPAGIRRAKIRYNRAMTDTASVLPPSATDCARRFLFEEADVRGETVHLDAAYRDILAIHQYAPGVSRLLGEFLAAAVLLASNLKFEGKLTLQARSGGEVPLLMAECDDQLRIRGIARGAEHATATDNEQLLRDGQLAITIDPIRGQRYQGVVVLEDGALAASLDAYFEQSEQLRTRIWLAADGARAAGLLLQQLPAQLTRETDARLEQWDRFSSLAATVDERELVELDAQALLYRLYHDEKVRLFDPAGVEFHCSCSEERSRNALSALQPAEIEDILQESGVVTVDCEFCNQQYRFGREDLGALLGGGGSKTLH